MAVLARHRAEVAFVECDPAAGHPQYPVNAAASVQDCLFGVA